MPENMDDTSENLKEKTIEKFNMYFESAEGKWSGTVNIPKDKEKEKTSTNSEPNSDSDYQRQKEVIEENGYEVVEAPIFSQEPERILVAEGNGESFQDVTVEDVPMVLYELEKEIPEAEEGIDHLLYFKKSDGKEASMIKLSHTPHSDPINIFYGKTSNGVGDEVYERLESALPGEYIQKFGDFFEDNDTKSPLENIPRMG